MEARTVDYSSLFKPFKVGTVALKNRIVVPPMLTLRDICAPDGIEWYSRLARGGAGLVIVEATSVNRFESELSASGLAKLAEAVHTEGAAVAIQLFPADMGVARAPGDLTLSDIEKMKSRCVLAARKCKDAGFDGVEPHGAHGFLLNQFFSPIRNSREDSYGCVLNNRMRLGREIVRAVRQETGDSFLILYRHTPREETMSEMRGFERNGEGYTIDDSIAFARALVGEGVDVMDISPASDKAPADLAEPFKKQLGCPVIAVNDMDDPDRAVEALREGRADLIAVGRGLIADAEWPRKVQEGRMNEIVKCVKCDLKCFGNLEKGLPIECAEWE